VARLLIDAFGVICEVLEVQGEGAGGLWRPGLEDPGPWSWHDLRIFSQRERRGWGGIRGSGRVFEEVRGSGRGLERPREAWAGDPSPRRKGRLEQFLPRGGRRVACIFWCPIAAAHSIQCDWMVISGLCARRGYISVTEW
jgi:hypothetical protein